MSEGCELCYAMGMSSRNPAVLGVWGDGPESTRPSGSEAYIRQPDRWNTASSGDDPQRVFCGSLMDFFEDRQEVVSLRKFAFSVMAITPNLRWLLLTKRPQNIKGMLPDLWKKFGWDYYPNIWLGCTVENTRRMEERLPHLLSIDCKLRWLSVEPLLEEIDLSPYLGPGKIGWVIVGGESNQCGQKARPFNVEWAESIVEQCRRAKIPCFVKQMGSRPIAPGLGLRLKSRHGADPSEWPEWLRVQEVPHV